MSIAEAIVLRAASIWTLWIWGTRIMNILRNAGHSTQFKVVHSALALVSVAFALAIWVIAGKNRRRAGVPGDVSTEGPAAGAPESAGRPV